MPYLNDSANMNRALVRIYAYHTQVIIIIYDFLRLSFLVFIRVKYALHCINQRHLEDLNKVQPGHDIADKDQMMNTSPGCCKN